MFIGILVGSATSIFAEDCQGCPKSQGMRSYHEPHLIPILERDFEGYFGRNYYAPKWAEFHCNEIRVLKERVKKLESELQQLKSQSQD